MNNEMTTHEMIAELDRINELYEQQVALSDKIDNIATEKDAEDNSFLTDVVEILHAFQEKEEKNFGAKKPNIAPACLVVPPEPPKKPAFKNPSRDIFLAALSGVILPVSIILYLLFTNFIYTEIISGIAMLAFIVSLLYWILAGSHIISTFVDWKNAQKEWETKQAEWETTFNKSATAEENDRFLIEFKEYDSCFLSLVEVCTKKYNEEIEKCDAGLEVIRQKYIEKLDNLYCQQTDVTEQLNKVTLIHSDLFDNAWRISSMLKTGRADTLKEAINLALDEERKDMEEAERRAEARHQEAILEQQAYENRKHNEAMARAAEEHNAAMERAAEAQAREAAKQTAMAQQQAREAQRAASARCARCVNSSKCSYQVKQNSANCSGYRPR